MDRENLYRVFFDGNDWLEDRESPSGVTRVYDLRFPQSELDLERIGADLREGLRVVIYSPGELELEAVLEFSREWQRWATIGEETTLIHHSA